MVAYADDFALVCAMERTGSVSAELQFRLGCIYAHLKDLQLSMNEEKLEAMLFRDPVHHGADTAEIRHFVVQLPTGPPIAFAKVVEEKKFLGVRLDHFLSFKGHINEVILTATRSFQRVRQVMRRQGLSDSRKVWVYKQMIRPILTYACPVWLLMSPSCMEKLRLTEYRLLNAIFGKRRRSNGHYFSYRSRRQRAKIPAIDYHIVMLTRRHLVSLESKSWARVNGRSKPNLSRELKRVLEKKCTVETTMFADAWGLLQDDKHRNILCSPELIDMFASLDSGDPGALSADKRRRALGMLPTEYDLQSCAVERRLP